MNFKGMADEALQYGWASTEGTFEDARASAAKLGWEEVKVRTSDPSTVTTLSPKQTTVAAPNSMSAKFGLDQQPLHTDCAHHPSPPRLVLLHSESPTDIPTILWRPRLVSYQLINPQYGMFLVRAGKDSFFAPALSDGAWRLDPGCMDPADERAVAALASLQEIAYREAMTFHWEHENTVLLIDNHKMLHGRARVANKNSHRELSRVSFARGGSNA